MKFLISKRYVLTATTLFGAILTINLSQAIDYRGNYEEYAFNILKEQFKVAAIVVGGTAVGAVGGAAAMEGVAVGAEATAAIGEAAFGAEAAAAIGVSGVRVIATVTAADGVVIGGEIGGIMGEWAAALAGAGEEGEEVDAEIAAGATVAGGAVGGITAGATGAVGITTGIGIGMGTVILTTGSVLAWIDYVEEIKDGNTLLGRGDLIRNAQTTKLLEDLKEELRILQEAGYNPFQYANPLNASARLNTKLFDALKLWTGPLPTNPIAFYTKGIQRAMGAVPTSKDIITSEMFTYAYYLSRLYSPYGLLLTPNDPNITTLCDNLYYKGLIKKSARTKYFIATCKDIQQSDTFGKFVQVLIDSRVNEISRKVSG